MSELVRLEALPVWPDTMCAGCGTTDRVDLVEAALVLRNVAPVTRFMLGHSLRRLPLPYCLACRSAASRMRAGWVEMIGVFGLIAFVTFIAEFAVLDLFDRRAPLNALFMCTTPLVIATSVVVGWYGTRKARPPTVSWYQPVWLAAADEGSITFGLEQTRYARAFREANGLAS